MPGDNCSVFGCGTSRRTKGLGLGLGPPLLTMLTRKTAYFTSHGSIQVFKVNGLNDAHNLTSSICDYKNL